MTKIVMNDSDYEELIDVLSSDEQKLLIPINRSTDKHYLVTDISVLYVGLVDRSYVLTFYHNDGINYKSNEFFNKFDFGKTFCLKKKHLSKYTDIDNLIDAELCYWWVVNNIPDFSLSEHRFGYKTHYKEDSLLPSIPLVKIIEKCTDLSNAFFNTIDTSLFYDEKFIRYERDMMDFIINLEKKGIFTTSGMKYTYYNPYTLTGRPSNSFANTNFSGLKNDRETRSQYISRFGKDGFLVSLDYTAYHPFLIAKMVGYDFCGENPYTYLSRAMSIPDDVSYDKVKGIVYQGLYGSLPKDINIRFFDMVKEYVDEAWKKMNTNGYIESPVYKRRFIKTNLNENDMHPHKLFNYVLQFYETEMNISTGMSQLAKTYADHDFVNIATHTYDSILVDVHKSCLEEVPKMHEILERIGCQVKIKAGTNYYEMKEVIVKNQ